MTVPSDTDPAPLGGDALEAALAELRSRLGERAATGDEIDPALLVDRSLAVPEGRPIAAVRARSTADVSAALAWAHEHRVPVSVRGAGTGLAGGAVAYPGGLVLSLADMDRILAIDPADRLADVEPGVITHDLDEAAREHGLLFAPDPASSHISSIGGNIASNAGGLRCVAHGPMQASVAELEVVLADGSVIRAGSLPMKNSTGLNLAPLFVGSEGTLGVITRATVRLEPIPAGTPRTFLASFDDVEDAGRAVVAITGSDARPEVLELIDATCARLIEEHEPCGLPQPGAALLLGETVGPDAEATAERLLATCREAGAAEVRLEEGRALLEARRLANPALMRGRYAVHCDVGVPISRLVEMIRGSYRLAAEAGRGVAIVAHAGDGNLHPAIEADETPEDRARAVEVMDAMTRLAVSLGGVVTGEHGIGSVKHHELPIQLDEATLRAQRAIKAALDPRGILTPGRGI